MAETLLSLSTVLLYGREVTDLKVFPKPTSNQDAPDDTDRDPARLGANRFLQQQISSGLGDAYRNARIARIYGFSFEGHYYDLPQPTLFLVHGSGTLAEGPLPSPSATEQRWSRAPSSADRTGLGSQTGSFASDMRVWSYDKGDFSIRLDASTGTFERILLESELSGDRLKTQIGAAAMMRMRATRGPDGD